MKTEKFDEKEIKNVEFNGLDEDTLKELEQDELKGGSGGSDRLQESGHEDLESNFGGKGCC